MCVAVFSPVRLAICQKWRIVCVLPEESMGECKANPKERHQMKHINGKQVFEKLSRMTEEQRERCVCPGFFCDSEYCLILDEVANNEGFETEPEGDSEYDVALATDKGMVAKWTREAMEECHEDWNAYIQQILNKIITHIVDEAKRK